MASTWTETVAAELHAEAERLRGEAPTDSVGLGVRSPGEVLADSFDRIAGGFGKYVVTADGHAEGSA